MNGTILYKGEYKVYSFDSSKGVAVIGAYKAVFNKRLRGTKLRAALLQYLTARDKNVKALQDAAEKAGEISADPPQPVAGKPEKKAS